MSGERVRQRARDEELKAREFREHGEYLFHIPDGYPVGESRWEDRFAAAFASLARKQEREDSEKLLKRCLEDAKDINSYSVKDSGGFGERLLKVAAHTTGMIIRLENQLAKYHERGRKVEG